MAISSANQTKPAAERSTASPDASLIQHEGFDKTEHRGLIYPFGTVAPDVGATIQVASGVEWVRIPLPGSLGHINCWIIDGPDGATIIDTGLFLPLCRDAWKAVLAGPLAGRKISSVLCTHLHPDHIGMAGYLCRKLNVPLMMTRGEWLTARLLIADARETPPDEATAQRIGAGWDAHDVAAAGARGWGLFKTIVSPMPYGYNRIVDGDALKIGDGGWSVVTGNGHSPEHACLYHAGLRILIAGDQVLPRISSNVSLNITEPDGNPLQDWIASLEKLHTLPADVLVCPAHGEPFTGLHTRLDALRDGHLLQLDQLHAHLAEPRRAVDCFSRLFRREIGDGQRELATGEALAHLRYLECAGRAVRTTTNGVWWYRAA
jgi:glyoxylase-like metal-dependent hydrolase (beta-lactamase superfamily II)